MKPFLHKSVALLKRSSPTILTFIGAAGVIATAISAVKATPKALILCEKLRVKKANTGEEEPTKLEYVKETWICYVPTAVIALSTIACIFGANILNKRQQAVITSAYAFLDNAFKEYKAKTKQLYGDEADEAVTKEVVKGKYNPYDHSLVGEELLFYEEYYDEYFVRTREEVLRAEYEVNKLLSENGFVPLNAFYDYLCLNRKNLGDFLGWSYDAGRLIYGYSWIDFDHKLVELNDGMECTIIGFPGSTPTHDYLDIIDENTIEPED